MKPNYNLTRLACYIGYVTQAITINLAPLFFIIFQNTYGISYTQIGQIVLVTFVVQIVVDLLCVRLIPRIGYRTAAVAAHVCAAVGLILLGLLPPLMHSAYAGILIAVFFYSVGGGLTEVIISPLIDSLPSDAKAASMSLLHSFYSWGQCLVVLLTTVILSLIGQHRWNIIPYFWAVIPMANMILFCTVPIPKHTEEDAADGELPSLLKSGVFYVFILLMISSGASEQVMSQWASLFAEKAIGVTKVVGDILGPCLFAVLMAIGRTGYGIFGQKIRVEKALLWCAVLTVGCYALTVFCGVPLVALIGCAMTGLGVSLMWPGVLSVSSSRFPKGGSPMFAILALAGDIGCSLGPWLSGVVSDLTESGQIQPLPGIAGNAAQQAMKNGMLLSSIFPLLMVVILLFFLRKRLTESA